MRWSTIAAVVLFAAGSALASWSLTLQETALLHAAVSLRPAGDEGSAAPVEDPYTVVIDGSQDSEQDEGSASTGSSEANDVGAVASSRSSPSRPSAERRRNDRQRERTASDGAPDPVKAEASRRDEPPAAPTTSAASDSSGSTDASAEGRGT